MAPTTAWTSGCSFSTGGWIWLSPSFRLVLILYFFQIPFAQFEIWIPRATFFAIQRLSVLTWPWDLKKCLCLIVLSYFYVYICVRSSALEWRALHGKKRDLDPLELQVVVSHFVMVGTELGTSARAVCTFNCWIFPPTRPWDFCWGYGSLNAFLKCFWTYFFTCGDMMSWYKQGRK